MVLRLDRIADDRVKALLASHLRDMANNSPAESVHALDATSLGAGDVSFWTAWEDDALLGCVALKRIDSKHGELKSMRTDFAHRGRGVARQMLRFVLDESRRRGYERLSLETGSASHFSAARSLYDSVGFRPCEPFSDYVADPFSVFMTLLLSTVDAAQ